MVASRHKSIKKSRQLYCTLINLTDGYLTQSIFINGDISPHSSSDASLKCTTEIPESTFILIKTTDKARETLVNKHC